MSVPSSQDGSVEFLYTRDGATAVAPETTPVPSSSSSNHPGNNDDIKPKAPPSWMNEDALSEDETVLCLEISSGFTRSNPCSSESVKNEHSTEDGHAQSDECSGNKSQERCEANNFLEKENVMNSSSLPPIPCDPPSPTLSGNRHGFVGKNNTDLAMPDAPVSLHTHSTHHKMDEDEHSSLKIETMPPDQSPEKRSVEERNDMDAAGALSNPTPKRLKVDELENDGDASSRQPPDTLNNGDVKCEGSDKAKALVLSIPKEPKKEEKEARKHMDDEQKVAADVRAEPMPSDKQKRKILAKISNQDDKNLQELIWGIDCRYKLLHYQFLGVRSIAGVPEDFPQLEDDDESSFSEDEGPCRRSRDWKRILRATKLVENNRGVLMADVMGLGKENIVCISQSS
jgi:hypothetical protein